MEASGIRKENKDVSIIILNSDSDDESDDESDDPKRSAYENQLKTIKEKKRKISVPIVDLATSPVPVKQHITLCDVSSTTIDLNDSVSTNETTASSTHSLPDFIPLHESQSVSTTENFIPFISNEDQFTHASKVVPNDEDDDVIIISSEEEDEIPIPIAPAPKLRPIVIDGSNVARLHGRPTNTYSCKGIKLSVEYFLNRGHTEVTAFVPMFRRHCKRGAIVTTDQEILEELEKTQHVVFTPSRRVEGKSYTCYDDRFIVDLAASNGGVILSNDNFKDLLDVSPEFKETINKRLLMYCFVGDKLMIPDDPLGVGGPRLPEFLAFPPT